MTKKPKENPNKVIYEMQAKICSALAHPVRLEILDLLAEGEKNFSDLLEHLEIPKANLSQHVSVLKEAGILVARKEGTFQYLNLAIPKIKEACSMVRSVMQEKIALEEKQNTILMKELRAAKKRMS